MNCCVLVTSPVVVDLELYECWLEGLDCILIVMPVESAQKSLKPLPHILSQYRNFTSMESYLQEPSQFKEQSMFPIRSKLKQHLVDRYFSVRNDFMRELFDIKFNSRSRKDLDEISEKTGISLFGNVKRIMKKVEDLNGNISKEITKLFLLSPDLALSYATVIFVSIHKMETTRKKLDSIKFPIYKQIISAMLDFWTSPSDQAEFDLALAQDLKEMKNFLFGSKDLVEDFVDLLKNNLSAELSEKITPSFIKNFLKDLLDIGISFSNPKEIKLILVNIIEELLEPCVLNGLETAQVTLFLELCHTQICWLEQNSPNIFGKRLLSPSFSRMIQGISACLACLLTRE